LKNLEEKKNADEKPPGSGERPLGTGEK